MFKWLEYKLRTEYAHELVGAGLCENGCIRWDLAVELARQIELDILQRHLSLVRVVPLLIEGGHRERVDWVEISSELMRWRTQNAH